MNRFGAVDGGHLYDSLCTESARIHLGDFLQLGGEVHLLHQIEVVVAAGRAVCAEAHGDASGAFFDHGSDTAGQHRVAAGIVHAAHAFFGEELAVGCGDPDAMGSAHFRTE